MDSNHPTVSHSRQVSSRSRLGELVRRAGWFASGMAVVVACLAIRWYFPADSAAAAKPPVGKQAPGAASKQPAAPGTIKRATATQPIPNTPPQLPGAGTAAKKNPVAAIVNNEPLTRADLADECLIHHGPEVLDSMIHRMLIQTSCEQRGITITDEQVSEEISRMAKKFNFSREQWLATLQKERGLAPARYANDIIWPTLALRELAKDRLQVTRQELDDAFESEFGPAVKVRLIAVENPNKAKELHAQATAKPEEFPALAKKFSQDPNSASAYGLIQPIRRHLGDEGLENAAFALKKGEISPIVPVGNLHVFVKCEEHLPPPKGVDRAKVEPLLIDALKERKLRNAANDVFKQLQSEATVDNVYNDPAKSKAMPGVAAVINGQKITIRQLADECMERYGKDVLEGAVTRRMIDQALRKQNLKVDDKDIEGEIARAAMAMGKVTMTGEPDVAGWIEYVTDAENITREVYVRDEVWPSAALKKLVGDQVKITSEDLQRGFEANYGPRVQCRAIVLNNQRRAQEVWEMVRENPSIKNFGDLAEKYSVEAGSRSLRGEVPPIQKHGGQPLLEKEAFELSPDNPLSGIIQTGTTFIILLYEGRTKPVDVKYDEVKDMIQRDIQEKKLRLAMAKAFDNIKDNSHVDNFLTGEIKAAKKASAPESPENVDPGIALPRVLKSK